MAQKQSVLILCLINLSTVARNIGRDYSLVFGRLPTLPKSSSHRIHITDSWPTIKLSGTIPNFPSNSIKTQLNTSTYSFTHSHIYKAPYVIKVTMRSVYDYYDV